MNISLGDIILYGLAGYGTYALLKDKTNVLNDEVQPIIQNNGTPALSGIRKRKTRKRK
jgi:hypothetical protein